MSPQNQQEPTIVLSDIQHLGIKNNIKKLIDIIIEDDRSVDIFVDIKIRGDMTDWFSVDSYDIPERKTKTLIKLNDVLSQINNNKWIKSSITYATLYIIYLIVQQLESNNSLTINGVLHLNTLFSKTVKVFK